MKWIVSGCLVLMIASQASAQWYSGGTLHRADGQQWKSASGADRLATSADFAAKVIGERRVKKLGSIDKLRPYATDMRSCIDSSLSDLSATAARRQSVASLAAACSILLESQWDRALPR